MPHVAVVLSPDASLISPAPVRKALGGLIITIGAELSSRQGSPRSSVGKYRPESTCSEH